MENSSTATIDSNEATDLKEQNQNPEHEQAQGNGNTQEGLTGFQPESIGMCQSGTGDSIAVEEPNQEQASSAATAESPENTKIGPILTGYACRQSPELRVLLESFDKDDFDQGKKSFLERLCPIGRINNSIAR